MSSYNELTGIEIDQIFDEFQYPPLDLSKCIYLSLVSHVLTPVSVVYLYLDHILLKLRESQDR